MGNSLLRPAFAFLILGMSSAALHAQETSGNAGVSGEADYNMYCANCHGDDGKGNGPKAFGLSKRVPDITLLSKHYGSFPREKLARLVDGRDPVEGHGSREMPVWGIWFKEEAAAELGGAEGDEGSVKRRVDNLIDYIETLQVK